MATRLPAETYDQLRHLHEIHEQLAGYVHHMADGTRANEALRRALAEAAEVAEDHARRLPPLLDQWAGRSRRVPVRDLGPGAPVPNRELVESWIEIAEGARELYERGALEAPNRRIAEEMRRLAEDEARVAARLRTLL